MQVKTFRALTMKDAIAAVKAELGSEAVVLSTRNVKKLQGFLGRGGVEVTAALTPSSPSLPSLPETPVEAPAAPPTYTSKGFIPREEIHGRMMNIEDRLELLERRMSENAMKEHLDRIGARLDELTQVVASLATLLPHEAGNGPAILPSMKAVRGVYERLTGEGVEEDLAREIAETVARQMTGDDEFFALELAAREIMNRVNIADPFADIGRRQIMCALVGPTGVGKTTTIAKLAAAQVIDRGKKAAFFTVDTFRIGAVEQLRTYARIMGAPFEVAIDETDLAEKMARHTDKDVLFLDTAGSGQKDTQMMRRLAGFFDGRPQIDVHLIVSATTQRKDLTDIADSYRMLPVSTVMASKLDECNALGGMFTLMARGGHPFSYFTIGQQVPDDIEVATKERVVDRLLGITTH